MYYYVYILESISQPQNYYVGCTANLKRRLERHNQGGSLHTSKYKPWRLTIAVSFTDKHKAYAFEKYLKSHSGRAFSKKHF
ncbi:MAG: GIY-YIG nuclease family protein [Bacteroidetes bacterium]|nr:GIY-YIG nuclease family protein [Bacteroidota bacterium]